MEATSRVQWKTTVRDHRIAFTTVKEHLEFICDKIGKAYSGIEWNGHYQCWELTVRNKTQKKAFDLLMKNLGERMVDEEQQLNLAADKHANQYFTFGLSVVAIVREAYKQGWNARAKKDMLESISKG